MVERIHNTPDQYSESELLMSFIHYYLFRNLLRESISTAKINRSLFRLLCSGLNVDTVTPETVIKRVNDLGLNDIPGVNKGGLEAIRLLRETLC